MNVAGAKFTLNFYGRRLPVAFTENITDYQLYAKDCDVFIKVATLAERFPQNPLDLLVRERRINKKKVGKASAPTKSSKVRHKRERKKEAAEKTEKLLCTLMAPVLNGSRIDLYVSIKDFRLVLQNALDLWSELSLPRTVYVARLDSPSSPDALYLDCREWFSAWLKFLSSDLPEAESDVDALSFYSDWARSLIDRYNSLDDSAPGAILPDPPKVYSSPQEPQTIIQALPAPVESFGQQMDLIPKGVIEDTVTTITVETKVSLRHTTRQELEELAEGVRLIDSSNADIRTESDGTLSVRLTVPTYCGYPISEGNHGIAFQAAAQHIDNLLRMLETAKDAQDSMDKLKKLNRAYSGR